MSEKSGLIVLEYAIFDDRARAFGGGDSASCCTWLVTSEKSPAKLTLYYTYEPHEVSFNAKV